MKLVFATHNQHKFLEVKAVMPNHIQLFSLDDIGCHEEIPETGETLQENAQLKSDFVVQNYGLDCFSDDTGLLVNALNGAPGVYSARYAGAQKNANDNMAKLLLQLENKENRSAYFETAISLFFKGEQYFFSGTVNGSITNEKRGEQGFGYDPIFVPDGFDRTFAELPMKTKNSISHRGRAMAQLIYFLEKTA